MKQSCTLVGVLLVVWLVLGFLAEIFLPAILTGNRVLDAILISAAVTFLLAELAEVLLGAFLLLTGRLKKERA